MDSGIRAEVVGVRDVVILGGLHGRNEIRCVTAEDAASLAARINGEQEATRHPVYARETFPREGEAQPSGNPGEFHIDTALMREAWAGVVNPSLTRSRDTIIDLCDVVDNHRAEVALLTRENAELRAALSTSAVIVHLFGHGAPGADFPSCANPVCVANCAALASKGGGG